ncbi:MAG: ComEC/Rec2 family competence protein, partial [Thermodesulfobacteriota bacterium]|nr:ComEC/Rec2 family competence protein [Thermodesulfobacteriota bacterium]
MIKRPLVPISISFLIGVSLSYYLHASFPLLCVFFLGAFLTFLLCIIIHRRSLAFVVSLVLFVSIGLIALRPFKYSHFPARHITHFEKNDVLTVFGTVYDIEKDTTGDSQVYIFVDGVLSENIHQGARGRLMVRVKGKAREIFCGDRLALRGRLSKPKNFGNPNQFDYTRYLAFKGVFITMRVNTPDSIIKIEGDSENGFLNFISMMRENVSGLFHKAVRHPECTLLDALLVGNRKSIPIPLRESFINSGVAHLLAISGLHIGIVATFSFFIFRWLLQRSEWLMLSYSIDKLAAVITFFIVLFYAFLAGMSTPTLRAFLMIAMFLCSFIIERQREMLNTLCVAGFFIAVCDPPSLFNVSFQLTFVSVLFIILFTPLILERIFRRDESIVSEGSYVWLTVSLRRLCTFLIVTLVAIAATAPLIVFHFNRFSTVGILGNLCIVPIIAFVVVPLGLLSVLLFVVSEGFAVFILKIVSPFLTTSIQISSMLSKIPFSSVYLPNPNSNELALIYLCFVAVFLYLKRVKYAKIAIGVLLLCFVFGGIFVKLRNELNDDLTV